MTTLDDAWAWYTVTHQHLKLFRRLARPDYWAGLPIDRDDAFKFLDPSQVQDQIDTRLPYLDDLAIVVLFSVFEAIVRDQALELVRCQRVPGEHPVIGNALDDVENSLREGSFFRVLEAYKGPIDKNLVEHVNQVRKYRNWVAHGRRARPEANVDPRQAYTRLRDFLAAVDLV